MREIKFRGKRLDSREWIYGSLVGIDDIAVIVDYRDFGWNPQTDVNSFWFDMENNEVDTDTLGQYTGLKDKNGKEIYEGDIIGWKSFIENGKLFMGIIKWYTDLASFAVYTSLNDIYPYETDLLKVTQIGCEVIGNIYDNPELLKTE